MQHSFGFRSLLFLMVFAAFCSSLACAVARPGGNTDVGSLLTTAERTNFEETTRYELLGYIGHGGFGWVYQGQSALGRRVAIKVLGPDFKKCIQEGQAAARVDSDFIVTIHEYGELPNGRMFLQTAPYLSPHGSHLPRLKVPIPLHLVIGRRAAFAASRWIATHQPTWLEAPPDGLSLIHI